jgi:hypothetical protein
MVAVVTAARVSRMAASKGMRGSGDKQGRYTAATCGSGQIVRRRI